jgi:Ca2+-binding RTX toxin-like protein
LQTQAVTATGGFANIGVIAGSTSAANKLIGPNTPNAWSITANNAGNVNSFSFTAISNLTGGIDSDVFKFSNAKFVSGAIDGGGGGDWLDYSSYTTSVTVNLATGVATGVTGGVQNIQNVRAGSGGSMLTGNAHGNILVGGAGADTIIGGSGRSLLIGGKGSDSVTGGSADDIVIGGYTSFDTNNAALMSILAEWQRTDETYSQRVNNLKFGGGLNGTNLLVFGSTVKDDLVANTLTGGAGMDWFFMGAHDVITDLAAGEQVN